LSFTRKHQYKKAKIRYSEYYDQQQLHFHLYEESKNGKQFDNLYSLITSDENIKLAYRSLKSNKGSYTVGTDDRTIRHLSEMDESVLVETVRYKLKNYMPQSVRRVEIPKGNGKMRPLGIPTIMDRLIQQCFLQVLEPICEAKFYGGSYGFRPNRSCEQAIAHAMKYMQQVNLHYVVDIDIKSFFDHVNHRKLLHQLWTIGITDSRVLAIIAKMLKAEVAGIGFPTEGTPQGGIISPLLSNVVLNELDWWIASQWENIPTEHPYAIRNPNGKLNRGMKYVALRKSKLKEVYIIRYADDFKIFCRKRSDADKIFMATKLWLKERLGLDISPEKSKVVNLKKNYSDFLGFQLKVERKGYSKAGEPKYIVKSHISPKAKSKIIEKAKAGIEEMQHQPTAQGRYSSTLKWAAFVMGEHNYYRCATCTSKDFSEIAYIVNRSRDNRLKPKDNRAAKKWKYPNKPVISKSLKERYGKSPQMRYLDGQYAIVPISYCQHKAPMMLGNKVCKYTPEGIKLVHKNLEIDVSTLVSLMRNPVRGQSVEYNDNRLSLFAAQWGKCAVSGEQLRLDNTHCHHKTPRKSGGNDKYQNLVLVTSRVHQLIHAANDTTITRLLDELSLTQKDLQKLNRLRLLAGNQTISIK
jgi:group II intron reverse transcriptase/maturase